MQIRKLFGSKLAGAGFLVTYAKDGFECIDMAKRTKPDLIVLDIMMPELDGIAALKKLKADPDCKSIPILFLTSLDDTPAAVQTAKEMEVIEVIHKTVDLNEFLAKIINIITAQEKNI